MDIRLKITLDEVQADCFERLLLTNIMSLNHQIGILTDQVENGGMHEEEEKNMRLFLKDSEIQLALITDIAKELVKRENRIIT